MFVPGHCRHYLGCLILSNIFKCFGNLFTFSALVRPDDRDWHELVMEN